MFVLSVTAGMPRYPTPYPVIRPGFPPRLMPPPGVLTIQRPPMITGIRPPVITPAARPPAPAATPPDKPPTAVYVGKIAPTVDNDFLLSLLRVSVLLFCYPRCLYGMINLSISVGVPY
jgi:RNA-binding protein 25